MNRSFFNAVLNISRKKSFKSQKIETYLIVDGKPTGPFSNSELKVLVENGYLVENTLVWIPGYENWQQAQYVPHVNKLFLLSVSKKSTKVHTKVELPVIHPLFNDLVAAMTQLGASKTDAKSIANNILTQNPQISLSDAIKLALQNVH